MSENIMTFFRSNRGSISIEFSILFVLFLFILLSSAEMARLFYISSNLDLAVSEATKAAKNKSKDDRTTYNTIVRQKLITQTGIFGVFITNENIITQVVFSNSIDDIINDSLFDSIGNDIGNNLNEIISGGRHNDDSLPLAKYTIIYSYQPIFFPISSVFANTLLRREVIFVQEN
ncbi:pilus assembly protein [Yersinia kristensenii]|uniref:TadE/TadG family type IV pilus assembly protein n=1 Tax=Yersinia kristensenii TaxID=28152 RepID=UPI001C60AE6D|nr:TadE/TadG family type IV pilus assembly protein [Yersinia kristensenii]MBW5825161.1 pilus assembly protein [Yersinia kristensenii]